MIDKRQYLPELSWIREQPEDQPLDEAIEDDRCDSPNGTGQRGVPAGGIC